MTLIRFIKDDADDTDDDDEGIKRISVTRVWHLLAPKKDDDDDDDEVQNE